MNRIQSSARPIEVRVDSRSSVVETGRFETRGEGAPVCLFSPLHYERNYAYPLIVWLHGPDDDERQLRRIMPLVSMRNYVAVAPRGSVAPHSSASAEAKSENSARSQRGFAWAQSSEHIAAAESAVMGAVELARQRLHISEKRIYLAGYDCGGTMALRLALQMPDLFAGAASLGGAMPAGNTPLLRLRDVRRVQLLLSTWRDSTGYSQQQVCDDLKLLHAAGMPVCLRQYPCRDELTTAMLADMDRWIMDQVNSQSAVAIDSTTPIQES